MREIESLCEEAGPGKLSKTTAQRICSELRERFPPPGRSRPGGYVLWITPERVGGSGPWASHRRQG
jgi:hypothetical protein